MGEQRCPGRVVAPGRAVGPLLRLPEPLHAATDRMAHPPSSAPVMQRRWPRRGRPWPH